jgi:hypothetical protein
MKELINFKDQNLNLDYLTLNIPNSVGRISEFAEIFFRYGFNSKVFYVATNESQTILEDKKLFHTLTFRLESDSWNKETVFIQFSGDNSRRLYFLITNGYFSISLLNCQNIKIGRIDIQFLRPNKTNDTDVNEFLEKSLQVSKDGIPQRDENDNIQTLSIGKREYAYYRRIYKMDSALKFELEIKNQTANSLGLLLLNGFYQDFESTTSRRFLKHLKKSLSFQTCFTDWLLYSLRTKVPKPKKYFVTSYLKKYLTNVEDLQLYRLLQFLSFVRSYAKPGRKEVVNQQIYITVQFYLVDFMQMVDAKKNTYQRKQFLEFFDNLMGLPPYQEQFSDKEFRKLLFFAVVNAIQTTERGPWIIQVAVAQTLMHDFYPFHFPPSFFSCSSTINLQVKLSIIRSFAQEDSLQKTYLLQSFLNQYAKRSNSIQAQVKREVLQEFQNLLKYQIIQPKFEFSVDGNHFTQKYNIQLEDIRSYKVIHFHEIIHY